MVLSYSEQEYYKSWAAVASLVGGLLVVVGGYRIVAVEGGIRSCSVVAVVVVVVVVEGRVGGCSD